MPKVNVVSKVKQPVSEPEIHSIETCQAQVPAPSIATTKIHSTFAKEELTPSSSKISNEEKLHFYKGEDHATLQALSLQKIRELEEKNENLQREILKIEKELSKASDPLALLAQKEHCNMMIARNTAEILNTHTQNEKRIERIRELEIENQKLKEEVAFERDQFFNAREMQQRINHGTAFFYKKAKLEKNSVELENLNES